VYVKHSSGRHRNQSFSIYKVHERDQVSQATPRTSVALVYFTERNGEVIVMCTEASVIGQPLGYCETVTIKRKERGIDSLFRPIALHWDNLI